MGRLIYSSIVSLDGYSADERGNFDWAAPDEEVHAFVNDLERPIGTYLYGRRMYEVMTYWASAGLLEDPSPIARDYAAVWQAADKVVFSRTLAHPSTARTRIAREFDVDVVRELKRGSERDLSIGGAELANAAFALGLIDECQLFLAPIIVGGGKRALPAQTVVPLELQRERRFRSGFVFVGYRVRSS